MDEKNRRALSRHAELGRQAAWDASRRLKRQMHRFMKMNIVVPARPLGSVFMLFVCLCAGLADGPTATPPVIDRIERDGNSIRFRLTGPQLYDYTVEVTDSLSPPQWSDLARYRAKLGPIDVVVTNSFTNAQTRFFRVRQEFCYCRSE